MSTKARYAVAADALADWKDALFSGAAPVLYPVGPGTLGGVELGPGRVVLLGGLPGGGKTALTVRHLELDGPVAYVVLDAADDKAGRGAEIPLRRT